VAAIRAGFYRDEWLVMGQADLLSSMTEGMLTLSSTRTILAAAWEAGWQDVKGGEWEALFTGSRFINGFWSVFAGADLMGAGSETEATRAVLGVRTLLPLNLDLRAWVDSDRGWTSPAPSATTRTTSGTGTPASPTRSRRTFRCSPAGTRRSGSGAGCK
jgi:hypothetical protein